MSTYFDIVCLPCAAEFGLDNARDEEALLVLVKNRLALADISNNSWLVDLRLGRDTRIPLYLFHDHREHALAVKCEYESFAELEERLSRGLLTWKAFQDAEKPAVDTAVSSASLRRSSTS